MISVPSTAGAARNLRGLAALSRHPWVLTAALCAAVLVLPAGGPDYAAQLFRTKLFQAHGNLLWDNSWYSGHLIRGYSLLYPPTAALVGPRLLGALCAVASTVLVGQLFSVQRAGRRSRAGVLWFSVVVVGELLIGRLPFLMGVALGLGALLAVARHRWVVACGAALMCGLASPLAGAFLLLLGLAWARDIGLRPASALSTAAIGPGFAATLGGGGVFPFPVTTLACLIAFVVAGVVLIPPRARALRIGLALYGAMAVVLFLVPNPVGGGNLARMGVLTAGPLAAYGLYRPSSRLRLRRLRLPVAGGVALAALAWQLTPVAQAVSWSHDDPAARPTYYTGLNTFLSRQDPTRGRLEIPPLREHWEAAYVAPTFPLARGWERQTDIKVNGIFYQPGLDADTLHRWLVDSGVRLVALPDTQLDEASLAEARVLGTPQRWLRLVWADAHWRVWAVTDAGGLTDGNGTLTALGVDSFTVSVPTARPVVVRLHWSPYWQVIDGAACLSATADGWTTVTPAGTGSVKVAARWTLDALTDQSGDCGATADDLNRHPARAETAKVP